jgi:hypothetical protein
MNLVDDAKYDVAGSQPDVYAIFREDEHAARDGIVVDHAPAGVDALSQVAAITPIPGLKSPLSVRQRAVTSRFMVTVLKAVPGMT